MAETARKLTSVGLAISIVWLGGCADSRPSSTVGAGSSASSRPAPAQDSFTAGAPHQIANQARAGGFPQTDQGAADFVNAWFAALNTGYTSGRIDTTTGLSAPDCTACADYQADIASLAVSGAQTNGPPFRVSEVEASGSGTGVAVATLTYQVDEIRIRHSGRADEIHPGEAAVAIRAAVLWSDSGWVMGEIGL